MNLFTFDLSFSDISHSAMWIVMLVLCYGLAIRFATWTNQHILAHPILITTTLLLTLTQLIEPDVGQVMTHLHPIKYLLGPLTVGLALPVYNQFPVLRELGIKVIIPIAVGGLFAPLSAFSVLYLLDAEPEWQLTILTKSITTPFAMDTATMLGGIAGLAAVFNIITGMIGVMALPSVNRLLQINDDKANGIVLGTIAHGIGTSKAVLLSEQSGAFASLALCVNGVGTAIVLSLLLG